MTNGGGDVQICSFTGHRRIESRHKDRIDDLVYRAVAFAYESGCRTFLTGGALGFDTVAAKEVIRFKLSHPDVRLEIIMPCRNQSDSWSPEQISLYEYTLANADFIECISDEYTDSCMKERNFILATRCDMMIAYVSRPYSGAAQTVRMASKEGKVIYNLYPSLDGQ